jgi:hypothetical protein
MRLLSILVITFFISACSSSHKNQSVVGDTLPVMMGETLDKQTVELPTLFTDTLTLLLIGYKQDSQFDIDRWLIGLDMTKTEVSVFEVPAIQGMFPRMFSTQINNGMRRGIPKELWKGVITLYADGDAMQVFTGNQNGNNARVMLVNNLGKVMYFYDRGFSVSSLNEVRALIKKAPK